jgi:hypothetical protein
VLGTMYPISLPFSSCGQSLEEEEEEEEED